MPKALVPVAGEPMVVRAVRRAAGTRGLAATVVVVPPTHREQFRALLPGSVIVVDGGAERTESVAAGLAALPAQVEVVLVHDAARCEAPTALFDEVAGAVAAGADAAVPGIAVVDTIKQVDSVGRVVATPPRASLRAVQTPQGFRRRVLERAHAAGDSATDDAALVERTGGLVVVVPGDPRAHKVTTADDLTRIEGMMGG